jgi:flagellar basal body P-ring formation protein FlgA
MKKNRHIMTIIALLFGICFFPWTKNVQAKGSVSLNKASQLSVAAADQTIPEIKFRELFHEFICDSLGKDRSDVLLSRFKVTGNRSVEDGQLDFKIFQKSRSGTKGYVRLVAIVSVDGITKIEVGLAGWVDVFDDVVCTTRRIKKGEIISEKEVRLARKNVSRLSARVLMDIKPTVGLMARRDIKEGTCLKEFMLEKNPLVERGDVVTILVDTGGIRVTVPGMILERGYQGDFVKIRNSMSRKTIYARIINNSTAIVEF